MGRDYPSFIMDDGVSYTTCDGMRYLYSLLRCDSWKIIVRIEYSQLSGSPQNTHENYPRKLQEKVWNMRNGGMTDTFLTRTRILRKMWSQTWDFRYPECHFCLPLRLGQIVSALPWPPLLTTSGGLKLVARLIAVLPGVENQKMQSLRIMGSQNQIPL